MDIESIELLKQIPSGAWATIGAAITALITFFGFFLNNYFEDKRRSSSNKENLVRDSYFGAVEYISQGVRSLSLIPTTPSNKISELTDLNTLKNYYRLHLIASPQVLISFSNCSKKIMNKFFLLGKEKTKVEMLLGKINQCDSMITVHQKNMDGFMSRTDYLRDKGILSDDLFSSILKSYQEEWAEFNLQLGLRTKYSNDSAVHQLLLLKISMQSVQEISVDINQLLFEMRKDLNFKLNKKDSLIIQNHLDDLLKNIKSEADDFLNYIQEEMDTLLAADD